MTVQCSAGTWWVLAFMWIPHPDNIGPSSGAPPKNWSGAIWGTQQKSLKLLTRPPKFTEPNRASVGRAGGPRAQIWLLPVEGPSDVGGRYFTSCGLWRVQSKLGSEEFGQPLDHVRLAPGLLFWGVTGCNVLLEGITVDCQRFKSCG